MVCGSEKTFKQGCLNKLFKWLTEPWAVRTQLSAVLYLVSDGWVAFDRWSKNSKQIKFHNVSSAVLYKLDFGPFYSCILQPSFGSKCQKTQLKLSKQERERGCIDSITVESIDRFSMFSWDVMFRDLHDLMAASLFTWLDSLFFCLLVPFSVTHMTGEMTYNYILALVF